VTTTRRPTGIDGSISLIPIRFRVLRSSEEVFKCRRLRFNAEMYRDARQEFRWRVRAPMSQMRTCRWEAV
jgi:hypothetical protein